MPFPVSSVGQSVVGSKKSRKKGEKISTLKKITSPRNNLDIENVVIGQRPGEIPIENDYWAWSIALASQWEEGKNWLSQFLPERRVVLFR